MPARNSAPNRTGSILPDLPACRASECTAVHAGLYLAFQMQEQVALVHLPVLPAQYHYQDAYGTEVIYLAGRDTPLEGEVFPFHASRFWLYAGADAQAFQLALSTLVHSYQFTIWRAPCEDAAHEHEEVA